MEEGELDPKLGLGSGRLEQTLEEELDPKLGSGIGRLEQPLEEELDPKLSSGSGRLGSPGPPSNGGVADCQQAQGFKKLHISSRQGVKACRSVRGHDGAIT